MLRSRQIALALAAGSALPLAAHATILNYASAVSGTASTAARWSPAQVPVAADDLVFNATAGAQAFGVTFDATTATSRTLVFNEDTITLTMSSPHTTTDGVTISSVLGDNAVVTLSSGTWTSSFNSATGFDIGDVAGAVGTLNVTDDSADLLLPGTTARMRVGVGGTGTLGITGGGLVECGDGIIVGSNTGSTGTLNVSGAQAISPFQRSTLRCVDVTGLSHFGSSGSATVTISNGALVDIASFLHVSEASASTSTVTIGGSGGIGSIHDATLDVGGDLLIGANTSASTAGTGTVTVNSNGQVLVGGTLNVGSDPNGGSGTLNINTGSLVQASNVIDGALGTINHTGGTLRINGGTYTGHAAPLVVTGTGSPTLQYSGNSVNTLTAAGGVGLRVGDDTGAGTFTGNLIIDSGADVVMSGLNNDINIADDAGTSGIITVTGAGSRLIDNQPGDLTRVGVNGTGELRVESGGEVLATEIQVPASSLNGSGTLFMGNANIPAVVTTANLVSGNAAGGTGEVFISSSCTINATDPGLSVLVRNTGFVSAGVFGNLNAAGTILVDGGGLYVGGTVSAGVLVDIAAGGLLRTSTTSGSEPLVDAPVRVRSGGSVDVIFGDLTMGDSTEPDGVILDSGSSVTVGSGRTLTLRDDFIVEANGAIEMEGGTIALGVSNTAMSMLGGPSDQLTGFGTIDANILTNPFGVCAPSGTGLVFMKRVMLNGPFNAAGTAIRFGSTSVVQDLSGTHVLNCKVTADLGSVMGFNVGDGSGFGPITLGDGTTTGVTLNGTIHMGTNGSMTFNDSDGVVMGPLTDMNGGILACLGGITIVANDVLRGKGSIDVSDATADRLIIASGGTIDPDDYFADTDTYHGVATFFIDGGYTQQALGTYLCEIAGFNNEFQPLNDRISAGPVTLAGNLNIALIDGYSPQLCDEFTILTYTSRSGTWANIVAPPGVGVGVRYEATRAVLFFNSVPCDGIDFNGDGLFPDTLDIDDFVSVFGGGACSTGACGDIDFNNDCLFPDTSDVDSFISVFAGGPCI